MRDAPLPGAGDREPAHQCCEYTDPEGHIWLRAASDAKAITITVADNGIGIPADAIEGVFAMFSQVKSAQERSDGGLSIGLALAKGLIDLHGGTIEARGAGLGRSSEFTVTLPTHSAASPPTTEPGDSTSATRAKGRRVLIADDNEDAAESLAALLRMEGHEVTVVDNGLGALAAINTAPPEFALLDIGMPDLNGYEVAQQSRQGPFGTKVVLIAVTGWGQERDKTRALEAGFNYHFTKPIDPDTLLQLLHSSPSQD
jgi:CheY-like chemotaxis protein